MLQTSKARKYCENNAQIGSILQDSILSSFLYCIATIKSGLSSPVHDFGLLINHFYYKKLYLGLLWI